MTLQKVAEIAGVSTTTVHRVLSGKGEVSENTANMIMKIVKEVGYKRHPSQSASVSAGKAMPEIKTGNIGLVLAGLPLELLQVPLNAKLLSYLQAELATKGLLLTVIQADDSQAISPVLSPDRLDGAFLIGGKISAAIREKLRNIQTVGIFGCDLSEGPWTDWVTSDYQSRGWLAARYLVQRGHRNVAYINPIISHMAFEEVGLAFVSAARHIGANACVLSDTIGDKKMWSSKWGDEPVKHLIDQWLGFADSERPTGLHVANDEIAISVYEEFARRGVSVGRDVEIISCGNDEIFLKRLSPRPATMDLNVQEIARRAIEKLFYRMRNADSLAGVRVLVPPRLVEGEKDQ